MSRCRTSGFTLVEIMIVVTIIGMLSAIAIPAFSRARASAQEETCLQNQRQINGVKQQWALENFQGATATPTEVELSPYFKGGTAKVRCPCDPRSSFVTSYTINDVSTDCECIIMPVKHIE